MTQSAPQSELVDALEVLSNLLEKRGDAGTFYYEDVTLKRWELGPGGRTGNCEECIENADAGEIEESEFFPAEGAYGPVDEPPLHPGCGCFAVYRDTRRRVSV